MLKLVMMLPCGMVAAFDERGYQVPEAQGSLIDFYYQFMRERGLADPETVIEFVDPETQQDAVTCGASLDYANLRAEVPGPDPEALFATVEQIEALRTAFRERLTAMSEAIREG